MRNLDIYKLDCVDDLDLGKGKAEQAGAWGSIEKAGFTLIKKKQCTAFIFLCTTN